MVLDAHTRPVMLLGYPVAHSLSPFLHNTAFRYQGLNRVYLAAAVPSAALPSAVAGLRALGFLGANVTLPHKRAVVPLMDALSAGARAVGAVNTIVCREEGEAVQLYGDNTDVAGFLAPLAPWAGRLYGAAMTVLGAGGAARAVVYALLSTYRPRRLTLGARDAGKAAAFVCEMAPQDPTGALRPAAGEALREAVRGSTLVVNATPVGMHPYPDRTPWPHPEDFGGAHLVYDLIYTPEQTRLLAEAAQRGATTLGGMAMLLGQAAAAYAQWTGLSFPTDVVRAALRRHLTAPPASAFPRTADTDNPRPS